MEIKQPYFFECLRCCEQSRLIHLPPQCPRCASRNGIVTERQLPQPLATAGYTAGLAMTI